LTTVKVTLLPGLMSAVTAMGNLLGSAAWAGRTR
jgi:hypothetical protein